MATKEWNCSFGCTCGCGYCQTPTECEIRCLKDRVEALEVKAANTATCCAEPPKPAKTRGEKVAEQLVTWSEAFDCLHFHCSPFDSTGGQVLTGDKAFNLRVVRDYTAKTIDAERKAAWNEAIESAAEYFEDTHCPASAENVRKLKK